MTELAKPAVERIQPPAVVIRMGNPLLVWLLAGSRRSTTVGRSLVLLHVTGRRTGRVYSVPVGYHRQPDGSLLVLTSSAWRVNLRGGPTPVALTLLGRRVAAIATLQEDPDVVAEAYQRLIADFGLARATRRLGIRVNVGREPTLQELADVARREHLSTVDLRLGETE